MSGPYTCINLSKAGVLAVVLLGMPANSQAGDFNAKTIMEGMAAEQRLPYMSGVIEGLAYARYMKDGKKTDGMKCIYDWFYEDKQAVDKIYVAFGDFPNFTPAAIIAALVQKKCGD